MGDDRRFAGFGDFFPYYAAMHSRPATRWAHCIGTLAGTTIALGGLAAGRRRWLAAAPAAGYGVAWPAHLFIEGNNPASFGHPVWSLRGDILMIRMMLTGRDAELGAIAADWLAHHRD
jgi:hypothetical protein